MSRERVEDPNVYGGRGRMFDGGGGEGGGTLREVNLGA